MSRARVKPQDHGVTIREFAKELMKDWEPDDWFVWPPDVFALTSILLKTTGLYRYAVSAYPGREERLRCSWVGREKEAAATTREWYRWILSYPGAELPESIRRSKEDLFDERNRLGLYKPDLTEEACRAILHLHAVADNACGSFGIPSTFSAINKQVHFLANALLGLTGTLSRLPHRHGIVLPKMRAPQSGLTLRSFSHHLSFHQSEMSIRWQTIPWINHDYNTVNIMVVPMPYEISSQSFRPCDYSEVGQDVKNFEYFEYASEEPLDAARIVALLKKARREANRVHMLVFPELALTWDDLENLKKALEVESQSGENGDAESPFEVPLIIAGVRGGTDGKSRRNQVVFSAFFAGKWYDIMQDKHHRWKLNDSQIKQYSLAGGLNVNSQWWEGINVHRRRLTFLAPNGWLTLCPLICEDLAQLEPVSDLIRCVGPTLVIAILMDGPQLPHRWSARYASVLADDPGTSVLTVTSLGMALRSKAPGKPEDRTVALWKDQKTGWEPIQLKAGADAILMTISAKWGEEFTADGRSDYGGSATLILRGTLDLGVDKSEVEATSRRLALGRKGAPQNSESTDVLELSIFSYLVDDMTDMPGRFIRRMQSWAVAKAGADEADAEQLRSTFRPFTSVWERLMIAAEIYSEGSADWPPRKFKYAVARLSKIISAENKEIGDEPEELEKKLERWERLVKRAESILRRARSPRAGKPTNGKGSGLEPSEENRLDSLVGLSILWSIHNRLKSLTHDSFINYLAASRPSAELQTVRKLLKLTEDCRKRYSSGGRFRR